MKNLLLPLILLISLNTRGQNFHFGLSLNPALTGNLLQNDGSVSGAVEESFKVFEHRTTGYSAYLFTQYTLSPRASLQIGAGYAKTGYTIDRRKLIYAQPEPSAPQYAAFAFTHQDIILPVLFRYQLGHKKNHFYLIGGPTPQIKLDRIKNIRKEYADGKKTNTQADDNLTDYRRANVNSTFGIGYDLQLSAKVHLFFQPTFDCNLLGTSKSASLNRKIYSLGFNVGLIVD